MGDGRVDALGDVILAELQRGATSRAALCRLTGRSEREVRGEVAELRRRGHLIVTADGGGYQLARSVGEVRDYTRMLINRIWILSATVAAMETSADRSFGGGDGDP